MVRLSGHSCPIIEQHEGVGMTYYRRVGDVPHRRHTAFRDGSGALRYEELMGEEGFSSDSSLLYHRGVPSAIVDSQVWELPDLSTTPNHPLKPRHLKLHDLPPVVEVRAPASLETSGERSVSGGRAASASERSVETTPTDAV